MKHLILSALALSALWASAAEIIVAKPHDPNVLHDQIEAAGIPALAATRTADGFRTSVYRVTTNAAGQTKITFPDDSARQAIQAVVDAHDKTAVLAARAAAAQAAAEKAAADAAEKAAELAAARSYWAKVKNSELGKFLRIVLKHGVKLEDLE